ncbi:efflux RND transporter periplasmic adaptor subunit [Piscinibacter sakaiensis]|uniref:Multidrug resistance protein MdtA-like C-terminal permuted SH3 domain-containing protein n=1 Tax=Piscinibacter sakaiensis TaxID=1547922 RepID=A0A0K8NZ64_PISS1|nr:efflux RND transporter periplasmic adaptor subunit [Piscinibacter sakaiensis]GAP35604.1 hypothetical protein ISF6_1377 [Piscinibacter sakaiensis]
MPALALGLALAAGLWWLRDGAEALAPGARIERTRLTLAEVRAGRYDDVILLRGQAAPTRSVFLDAVEGGRVERRLVEDGALVQAGQPLVVLANGSLQLEVIRSEAEVANQLNNLRTLEIQLERLRADNRRLMAEIEWQLQRVGARGERDAELARVGFVSPAVLRDGEDERRYLEQRRDITRASQRTDEALQGEQARLLRESAQRLQANLALARANLDALTVRAPVAGRLTGFDLTPGQSLARGQRLGQVDSTDAGRVLAPLDEFHLPRVAPGQSAELELDGRTWPLRLARIDPQVKAGQFQVELVFEGEPPAGLRRGQTVQPRLALGASGEALLLPAGAFLADGDGREVWVVDGDRAERRAVTLGRRNALQVEVLAGLRAGEQVIVSSTASFGERRRVQLTD